MSDNSEDRQYFDKHEVTFKGATYYKKPLYHFQNDERLPREVANKLLELGYVNPSPIQAVSIPAIMDGKDFIGISQTGSGKTLAFLVPALIKMLNKTIPGDEGDAMVSPVMCVLAPTRELALQTYTTVQKFGFFPAVCLYGGESRWMQVDAIYSRRPLIVIGTPGRVNDLCAAQKIKLDKVKYFVLDEADRMFDMGFYGQICDIIYQATDPNRQTLLFSATWEGQVEQNSNPFLRPDRVFVSIGELKLKTNKDIKQHLFFIAENQKRTVLKRILENFAGFKILVFINTKIRCSELANYFKFCDVAKTDVIHGDLDQYRRTEVIQNFHAGKFTVLFATDVAARGLDIKDVRVVVNHDMPNDVDSYVHRIGRTARAGARGLAFGFLTRRTVNDMNQFRRLIKVVEDSGNKVGDKLKQMTNSYGDGDYSGGGGCIW